MIIELNDDTAIIIAPDDKDPEHYMLMCVLDLKATKRKTEERCKEWATT